MILNATNESKHLWMRLANIPQYAIGIVGTSAIAAIQKELRHKEFRSLLV